MPNRKKGDKGDIPSEITTDMIWKKLESMPSSADIKELNDKLSAVQKKLDPQKIESLETRMTAVENEVQELQKSLTTAHGEIEDLKKKNTSLQAQIDEQSVSTTSMTATIRRLDIDRVKIQEELRRKEDYSKRECLLFEGIEEKKNENCTDIVKRLIVDKIGINRDMKFQRVHRLGPPKEGKARPIIAKFLWYHDKQEVLHNAKNLKGTAVWVQEFFSETTTNRRKALVPLMRYMQRVKSIKCILIGDVLYAGNEPYTVETAKKLDFCQEAITRSDAKVLAFAGQFSFLSKFYNSPFEHTILDTLMLNSVFRVRKQIQAANPMWQQKYSTPQTLSSKTDCVESCALTTVNGAVLCVWIKQYVLNFKTILNCWPI